MSATIQSDRATSFDEAAVGPDALANSAFALLSTRQAQIMDELAAGLTNKEIALKFGLSPSTVKTHILSIYQKTKHKNRIRLALSWLQYGASVRQNG